MIQQTTEYEKFKKHPNNRPLDEVNLIKIQKSIALCNMLELRPILVDKLMRVIDGQHRLEAASRLNLPVFYQVNEAATAKDMIYLNAYQKAWGAVDYLRFFAREGNENYEKLERFIEKENMKLIDAMSLFHSGSNDKYRDNFKRGLFVFPDDVLIKEAKIMLGYIKEAIELIYSKLVGHKHYLRSGRLFSSFLSFYSIKAVDHQTFLTKLLYKLDLWRPCSTMEGYVEMMKQIYNWKNSEKLP